MDAYRESGRFRADRTEKVGAFRAEKKTKKLGGGGGDFSVTHTRTALIWEYHPGLI